MQHFFVVPLCSFSHLSRFGIIELYHIGIVCQQQNNIFISFFIFRPCILVWCICVKIIICQIGIFFLYQYGIILSRGVLCGE